MHQQKFRRSLLMHASTTSITSLFGGKCAKYLMAAFLLITFMAIIKVHDQLGHQHAMVVMAASTPRFDQFDQTVKVDSSVASTYFLPTSEQCRGYVEYKFPTYIDGQYDVTYTTADTFSRQQKKPPFSNKDSSVQGSLSMNLRNVFFSQSLMNGQEPKPNSTFMTVRFYPQLSKNVDPFSFELFRVYTTVDTFFKKSMNYESLDSLVDYGNYIEFNVDLYKVKVDPLYSERFQFAITTVSKTSAEFNVEIPLRYPRDVVFSDNANRRDFTLSYNHISPIAGLMQVPTVTVKAFSFTKESIKPYSFLLQRYDITENSNGQPNSHLIEERSFLIRNPSVIDLTCGYKSENQTSIQFDKRSTTIKSKTDNSITIYCKEMNVDSSYSLFLVANPPDAGKVDFYADYGVEYSAVVNRFFLFDIPMNYDSPMITDQFRISFQQLRIFLDETFVIDMIDPAEMSTVTYPQTSQNMTLVNVFSFKFNSTSHTANIFYTNQIKDGVDPSSFRLAKLNVQTNAFELVFGDEPYIGSYSWKIAPTGFTSKDIEIVYGFFYYDGNTAKIGEVQPVFYSKTLNYEIDDTTRFNFKYEMPTGLYETNDQPYVIVSQVTQLPQLPSSLTLSYQLIQALKIKSGNNLHILNNLDSRIFHIKEHQYFTNVYGEKFIPNVALLRCIYLFKETGFSTPEYSPASAIQDVSNNEFVIECPEDIKDEEYIVLLGVREINNRASQQGAFNTDIQIGDSITTFQTPNLFSTTDTVGNVISLQFSPYVSYTGIMRFKRLNDKLVNGYKMPVNIQSLTLMGGFELDISINTINERQAKMFINYDRNTPYGFNINPFSIRMVSLNSDNSMTLVSSSEKNLGVSNEYFPTAMPKVRFALFYQPLNTTANLNQTYIINFSRYFIFNIEPGVYIQYNVPFSQYTAATLPALTLSYFTNTELPDYELIYTFHTAQENFARYSLKVSRTFVYSKTHQFYTFTGRPIPDSTSLACAFYNPKFNTMSIIGKTTFFDADHYQLDCKGASLFVDSYFMIISTKKLPPIPPTPSPRPSLIPIPSARPSLMPLPSVKPEPSIIPIHSVIPPRPEPTVIPVPSIPRPKPEPSPVKPEPTIIPPRPEPTMKPEPSPIRPEPTVKPTPSVRPLPSIPRPVPSPVKPQPTIVPPKPSPITPVASQSTPNIIVISNIKLTAKSIKSGESHLFLMNVHPNQKVSFSFSSGEKTLSMFIGINYIPSADKYSYLVLANNQVQYDIAETGQFYILINGPKQGETLFSFETSQQFKKDSFDSVSIIIVISIITAVIAGCLLLVGLSAFVYWRKKKSHNQELEEELLVLEKHHDKRYQL